MSSRLMKSDSAGAVPRYGFRMMTLHPEGSRRRSFISTWLLDVIALGVLVDSDFCKCFILSFSFGSCTSLRWWRLVVRRPPREDRGSPFYLKCICPAQMREGGQDIFFFWTKSFLSRFFSGYCVVEWGACSTADFASFSDSSISSFGFFHLQRLVAVRLQLSHR